MAGINLSQSLQESKKNAEKKSLSDKGLIGAFVILLLVAGGWGGLRWYMQTLDDRIAFLEETLANNANRLEGENADRVADFNNRLILIGEGIDNAAEPKEILEQLERLTVPDVVLTKYEYNRQDHVMFIGGVTDNFKYLAQEILSLKSEKAFSEVKVEIITRTKEGKLAFVLKVNASGETK